MTINDLSQLRYLNSEIEQLQHRLSELTASATDTSVKISGLPHVHGVSNKTAIAVEIADLRTSIEERIQRSIVEYKRLNGFIAGVDDCLIRRIVTLRFVDGLRWGQIAQRIGGDNSESTVKVALHRYLKTCNECNE